MKKTPFKDIWHITEDVKDGEDLYKAGFYFVDETSSLNGPFLTLEVARTALKNYVESFLR